MAEWLVILNPNAGGGQAEKDWPQIADELKKQGFYFDLIKTRFRLDAIQLVDQSIRKGFRKIIAIGGDGTLHEIANGVMQQQHVKPNEILLGVVSVGTGNDWIKTHKISANYKEAIAQIKNGRTIIQDVGKITYMNGGENPESRYFVNSVGIGFDARVVRYIQPRKEKGNHGKGVYMSGLLRSLLAHKNIKTLLHIDEQRIETSLYNLTVGLCRFKGGGFKLLPHAIPDDGIMDITLASRISKLKLIKSLPKIFGGKVEKIKYFDFFKVSVLDLFPESPICVEADGEFLGYKPIQVVVIPNQLKLISAYHAEQ